MNWASQSLLMNDESDTQNKLKTGRKALSLCPLVVHLLLLEGLINNWY